MKPTFTKATKKKAKLRCAIYGPSGSGKTFSALRVASGIANEIGGRIAVIDTEYGSASKYADRFDFDCLDLADHKIPAYTEAIIAASSHSVLVIDSLSHAWQELLEEMDRLGATKYRGNKWSAWNEGTPKHKRFMQAILAFPGHVIATIRSKTEWATEEGKNGKSQPIRVGLAPEQGKGIEYEFDLLLAINTDHAAIVEKDRTGKFQDKIIEKPGEDFGRELVRWLNDGADPPPVVAQTLASQTGATTADKLQSNGHQPTTEELDQAREYSERFASVWSRESLKSMGDELRNKKEAGEITEWVKVKAVAAGEQAKARVEIASKANWRNEEIDNLLRDLAAAKGLDDFDEWLGIKLASMEPELVERFTKERNRVADKLASQQETAQTAGAK